MIIPGVRPVPVDLQASLAVTAEWLEVTTSLHNGGDTDIGVFSHHVIPTETGELRVTANGMSIEAEGEVLLVRMAALPVLPGAEPPGYHLPLVSRLAAGQQRSAILRIRRPLQIRAGVPSEASQPGAAASPMQVRFLMLGIGVFAIGDGIALAAPDVRHPHIMKPEPFIAALTRQRILHRCFELKPPLPVSDGHSLRASW
jgi:hypothetical protein